MNNMLIKLREELIGNTFSYKRLPSVAAKDYLVVSVELVRNNYVIKCQCGTSFVKSIEDLDDFLIDFKQNKNISKINIDEDKKVSNIEVIDAKIIYSNEVVGVQNGLMGLFENLISKKKLSEDEIKHAKAVSDVAGKIIDIEKVKLGYLVQSLK